MNQTVKQFVVVQPVLKQNRPNDTERKAEFLVITIWILD